MTRIVWCLVGLLAQTPWDNRNALFGLISGKSSYEVCGIASGNDNGGVAGGTTGSGSPGVFGTTTGPNSPAIWGESGRVVRVYGKGKEGGYFTTNHGGMYWNDLRYGVNVSFAFTCDPGVRINTKGDGSDGVSASTTGPSSWAVDAYSRQESAILAETGRPDYAYGVETEDKMCAMSFDTTHIDVAEYFPIRGDQSPWTVLVIGADKILEESSAAYDTRVAGIIFSALEMSLGIRKEDNPGEAPVAVAGRVLCRVNVTRSPTHAGNLLSTSGTPGSAMKAQRVDAGGVTIYLQGTIIGKAMGTIERGTGTIEVLVTLQ